jgi:hypothetical protein
MPEKKEFTLSPFQQDVFKAQEFSQKASGTVVEDFIKILDFVGNTGIPVSGVKKLFPLAQLSEINRQLTRPLTIKLKRPVQKSYPHINGLYLLVRASGLGVISSKGKKHHLVLDNNSLELWDNLTPADRYFSLLEAWWCRGRDEIIGEREGMGILDPLLRCLDFVIKMPKDGVKISENKQEEGRLKYLPGHHSLALLELFGFIDIQSGEPDRGEGWRIENITPTDWGKAVLESAREVTQQKLDLLLDMSVDKIKAASFELWRTTVQPYFTDWNTVLTPPQAPFQQGVHVFKVSIGRVWRKIAVSGNSDFEVLAQEILKAFEFYNDHLYQFICNDHYGLKRYINHSSLDLGEGDPCTDEVRLGELSFFPGMEMTFFFDVDDCWEFLVVVEEIDSNKTDGSEPVILERHGKAPEQYPDYGEW